MERLRTWWQALPDIRKRIAIAGAVAIVVCGSLCSAIYNQRTGTVDLYSNLSTQDLQSGSVELARAGILHQTVETTGAIRVSESDAAQARMVLAQAGLPRSGEFSVPGFELLDDTSLAASDFLQRANFLRALQGELAKSIATQDAILSARVHLSLPKPTIFEETRPEPSASVVVSLKPGIALSAAQTRAIVALVTGAVEDLTPERVAIVDTHGAVLAPVAMATGFSDGESSYWSMKGRIEEQIALRIQTTLSRLLGPDRAWVHVSVELDTDTRTTKTKSYLTPFGSERGVPITQETVTEEYSAEGEKLGTGRAGGAAGAASNLREEGATSVGVRPVALKDGTYSRTEEKTDFGVGEQEVVETTQPGSIKTLSVAVFVSGSVPEQQLEKLEQGVSAAAGIQLARGDVVSVVPVDLPEPVEADKSEASAPPAPAPSKIPSKWLAAAGVPAVLLMVAVPMVIKRRRRKRLLLEQESDADGPGVFAHAGGESAGGSSADTSAAPMPPEALALEKLRGIVRDDPEKVADLLRGWTSKHASSVWLGGQVSQAPGGSSASEGGSGAPNDSNN